MKYSKLLFLIFLTIFKQEVFKASCEEKQCKTPCSISKNFWMPRPFVSYQEHDLYQMKHAQPFKAQRKLNFSFISEYMQNFGQKCGNCKNLGAMPFWSGTNVLTIGDNQGNADLDAYQLGLGNVKVNEEGIAGTITLDPRVQHMGTDMMLYWVENSSADGFYFRVHAPLVALSVTPHVTMTPAIHSSKELGFTQISTGGTEFTYQYLTYPTPERRPGNILHAFWGGVADKDELAGALSKSIRLDYGRIAAGKQTAIRLGDITASFGYNFLTNEKGFAGIGFKFSCPTGNVPTALTMLEPIVGRAGLWGVGAELCGSYQVWENVEKNRKMTFLLEGELLHLFSGRTPSMRSFDLRRNGPGSKYMLLQHYIDIYASNSPDLDVSDFGRVNPNYEVFSAIGLIPAINHTTMPVKSRFDVEGSLAVMLDYSCNNWNGSLGAEVWGRSQEKLCIDRVSAVGLQLPNLSHYAVVGRQLSVYHVPGVPLPASNNEDNIYTYLVEPYATIKKSQNPAQLSGLYPSTLGAPVVLPEGVVDGRKAENRIPANYNEALDIEGAQVASAITGKIFGQMGYTFRENNYIPTIALLGGIEFTGKTNNAVQYWSTGLQFSLNF